MTESAQPPARTSRRHVCYWLLLTLLYLAWIVLVVRWAVVGAPVPEDDAPGALACSLVCGMVLLRWVATIALILAPAFLYGAIKRAFEPGELVCHCELEAQASEHLLPGSPIAQRAFGASYEIAQWPELAPLGGLPGAPPLSATPERRNETSPPAPPDGTGLSGERARLAAYLRGSGEHVRPLVEYKHWAKLPRDLQIVLRSGLPPRLILGWSLSCAVRALPRYEREFHQDTRPRQALGAALLTLRDGNVEAREVRPWPFFLKERAGCRVVRRTLWQRVFEIPSSGERAAEAIDKLVRAVDEYVEPENLWHVFRSGRGEIANAYFTATNRCHWSLPSFNAEDVAYEAARSADDRQAEYAWQRAALARLTECWPRWDEDRDAWRDSVEREWIPKIEQALPGKVSSNVPKYVALVRRTFVPWL